MSAEENILELKLAIQLDAGYPESKEDSLINAMFERIAKMSNVRSIETKCRIHM